MKKIITAIIICTIIILLYIIIDNVLTVPYTLVYTKKYDHNINEYYSCKLLKTKNELEYLLNNVDTKQFDCDKYSYIISEGKEIKYIKRRFILRYPFISHYKRQIQNFIKIEYIYMQ